jgi:hypothetical protein
MVRINARDWVDEQAIKSMRLEGHVGKIGSRWMKITLYDGAIFTSDLETDPSGFGCAPEDLANEINIRLNT